MSPKGIVKSDGGIQSALAVFLPSAQTFINIISQPSEKPTSNLDRQRERAIKYKSSSSTDQYVLQVRKKGFKTGKRLNSLKKKKNIFGENSTMNTTLLTRRGFELQPGIEE